MQQYVDTFRQHFKLTLVSQHNLGYLDWIWMIFLLCHWQQNLMFVYLVKLNKKLSMSYFSKLSKEKGKIQFSFVFGFFMGIEIFFPRKGFTARTVTFVDLEGSHHLTLFLGLVCFTTGQSIWVHLLGPKIDKHRNWDALLLTLICRLMWALLWYLRQNWHFWSERTVLTCNNITVWGVLIVSLGHISVPGCLVHLEPLT